MKKRTTSLLCLACLAAVLSGCGDGHPPRELVSGQVLIDGEPLKFGFVRFVSNHGRPASAELDEEGKFTLSSYGSQDGVIPGVHRVEVNASEWLSDNQRKWHAPPKYFNYQTSGLTQEITESTDSMVINLTWDGGKPFVERVR